ncbi:tyrosine-type recombinase/integrase [Lysobacter cavernae]|uniref:Tyrosine-type recombinase/integrase n=1 Tax=Lysobacter cavernae TaxID=1685901 RepID=A0ABV7RLT3_9GAMM
MTNIHSLPVRSVASGLLREFAMLWFDQMSVAWRPGTQASVRSIFGAHLLPVFGSRTVDDFGRAEVLALRAALARGLTPVGKPRSPRRVNRVMAVLAQLLAERERQLGVASPCRELRALPARRTRIQPFSLAELMTLAQTAPTHLGDYILIRGLTGLRSGEANGMRWDQVDWEAGTITISAARVRGRQVLPKNQFSERVIPMMSVVLDAMLRQWVRTGPAGGFVFRTTRGCPIDTGNFARRDWPNILEVAGMLHRAPEQLRHTAASLMLSAGEAPQFVASTLGHSDCRMLFTTYARWIPAALGRPDGQAIAWEVSLALAA